MLAKFDEGVRQAGQTVTYLATTAKAAGVLQEDGFEANTLARFLLDDRMQAAAKGGRVVVDEVSMLGHKDADRLFKLAEKLDLKLVLVGDPMQHGGVASRGVDAAAQGIRRHPAVQPDRNPPPEEAEEPATWRRQRAFRGQDARRLRHARPRWAGCGRSADASDRYRQIAADYLQALDEKKTCLVVSPTHDEAAPITHEIRSQLRDAGQAGHRRGTFTRLVAAEASEAERGEAATYRPGDVLQFHQNAKGFTKGERSPSPTRPAVPRRNAERFSLYRPEAIALAEGDKMRFTGTVKTLDGEHKLKNGDDQDGGRIHRRRQYPAG